MLSRLIIISAAILACTIFSSVYLKNIQKFTAFEEWKQNFGTPFDKNEQPYRRLIFFKNLEVIEKHNADSRQTYKMGINQFTIYSDEEFRKIFLQDIEKPKDVEQNVQELERSSNDTILGAIDWVALGKVTQVKNQGGCVASWAFSALGAFESYQKIFSGAINPDYSQQQLIDCSTLYGNHGCDGGSPSAALTYGNKQGLVEDSRYPYQALEGPCKIRGGLHKVTNYTVTSAGCGGIVGALYGRPIIVSVDASNWAKYSSGIFNNCAESANQYVMVVGYDTNGVWKIKNSWGTTWGEQGYIRLASGDTCGVCQSRGVYPCNI